MLNDLVIPSEIPWQTLSRSDLEECLFWLLDEMGAKDLEWRRGGKGQGAADQGRDVEATFYTVTPDGELNPERWWIEAKGRSGTVEPSAVKEAVNNSFAYGSLHTLIIATNSQFSNQTRDWLKHWQNTHPSPKVRLWDRDSLERMIVRHPGVALRLFANSLTSQGRLEAVRSRFWNQLYLSGQDELQRLWLERDRLAISHETLVAVTVAEMANGNIHRRPWPMIVDSEQLASAVVLALVNSCSLAKRAERFGLSSEPILRAAAYLLLSGLSRLPFETVCLITENAWNPVKGDTLPEPVRPKVIQAIVDYTCTELLDACSAQCRRVSADGPLEVNSSPDYWDRFRHPQDCQSAVERSPKRLIIEANDEPCVVGFALNDQVRCPLISPDLNITRLPDLLKTFRHVLSVRIAQRMAPVT